MVATWLSPGSARSQPQMLPQIGFLSSDTAANINRDVESSAAYVDLRAIE